MARRVVGLTLDNLDELLPQCRSCVFWELGAAHRPQPCEDLAGVRAKQDWARATLLDWGCCGQLVEVDGAVRGHVLYAPPAYVPRALAFATSPAADDAVLLMSAHVAADWAGHGLGRMLVQGLARDVTRRGVRAIEVFGRGSAAAGREYDCLVPVDFLLAVGFRTVRPHPFTPRLRLDIRSLVTWREEVESAFDRLLGSLGSSLPALGRH